MLTAARRGARASNAAVAQRRVLFAGPDGPRRRDLRARQAALRNLPVAPDCVGPRHHRTLPNAPAQEPAAAAHPHGAAACRTGVAREARAERHLGGLWSLPEERPGADIAAVCAQRYGAQIATHAALPAAHSHAHFRLDIEPHRLAASRRAPQHRGQCGLEEALGAAIPAPVKRILAALALHETTAAARADRIPARLVKR